MSSITSASARPRRSRTWASSIRSGAADNSWSSIDSASRMPPAASRAIRWTAAGSASRPSDARIRLELALDLGDRQAADVVALEARQDRRREARGLGRGEHEGDERRRLLERLEQRVPGVPGDLVGLVEDVDLPAQLARRIGQPLAQASDVVDAAIAGGVDLDQVEGRPLADRDARGAGVAGVAVAQVRAVERLGQDPGERCLARPARPDEQDRVADPVGANRVAEGLDDRLLADDVGEGLGAPAPVERLMRDRRGHDLLRAWACELSMPCTLRRPGNSRAHRDERLGPGRSAAPDDDRLVLLPSGPDTVRGSPLRGTRSSTSHRRAAFESGDLGREFSPAGADCRYRAPLVPRLARLRKDTPRRGVRPKAKAPGRTEPAPRSASARTAARAYVRAVAERAGFEPATGCPEPHFQCGAIVH